MMCTLYNGMNFDKLLAGREIASREKSFNKELFEFPCNIFNYWYIVAIVKMLIGFNKYFSHSTFIAVFNNMRTLEFKPQLTVYVFCCRQSSKRIPWETEAHFSRVKRSRLLVMIGRFRSILFASVFQGSLAVAIIMIDSSEKPNRQLGFEL